MTNLTPDEQVIALQLRQQLSLSLDDALEVMRRCLRPDITRSAIYRLWLRHGIAKSPPPAKPASAIFAPEPFGYVHVDLKHLTRLEGKPAFVFVAIERTTRFAYVEVR
jgi:hypothetical protein